MSVHAMVEMAAHVSCLRKFYVQRPAALPPRVANLDRMLPMLISPFRTGCALSVYTATVPRRMPASVGQVL